MKLVLGSRTTGESVELDESARYRGLYIIGTTGSGKTTLIESLVRQDMENGAGLCVLEPHGDLTQHLLNRVPVHRQKDVVVLDPSDREFPFGLNPFWCDNPDDDEEVDHVAGGFVELMEKLWGSDGSEGTSWGPQLAQILRNSAITLAENRGLTLVELPRLLADRQFRAGFVQKVRNPQTRFFWQLFDRQRDAEQDRMAQSTQNKVDEFLSYSVVRNIVGQSKSTVDFSKFMNDGKIVLIPLTLGNLRRPVVNLLGSLLVLEILKASFLRARTPEAQRRPFYLYADEYQRFATSSFSELLTDARKYRVATTIAHQMRAQLDMANREAALNAGNIVVFSVNGDDAEELARQFDRTPPEPDAVSMRPKMAVHLRPIEHIIRLGHSRPIVTEICKIHFAQYFKEDEEPLRHEKVKSPEWMEWKMLQERKRIELEALHSYLYEAVTSPKPLTLKRNAALIASLIEKMPDYVSPSNFGTESFRNRPTYQEAVACVESVLANKWKFSLGRAFLVAEQDSGVEAISFWNDVMPRVSEQIESSLLEAPQNINSGESASDRKHAVITHATHLLDRLSTWLREDPILVDSGQRELVLERPRSYGDVEAEIASRLVSQGQFQAICRIANPQGAKVEAAIRTPKWQDLEILDESHSFSDPSDLLTRSRQLVGRPRDLVMSDIQARFDDAPPASRSRSVPFQGES